MATEADLIQKFKDLNIPVGADFEELIHAAFVGSNLADQISSEVNAKQDKIGYTPADDSKVVHTSDMRKPASDVAGIEEVNAKQDKLTITPADDSKVAHLSGANNFDTVPMVNNNPLLLASSLPSDLARTSQQTNFTNGLQSGGVNVATAADIKSIEDSAWRELDLSGTSGLYTGKMRIKVDDANKTIYLDGAMYFPKGTAPSQGTALIDLSKVVNSITSAHGFLFFMYGYNRKAKMTGKTTGFTASNLGCTGAKIKINTNVDFYHGNANYILPFPNPGKSNIYVIYDELV